MGGVGTQSAVWLLCYLLPAPLCWAVKHEVSDEVILCTPKGEWSWSTSALGLEFFLTFYKCQKLN
jgi:hypothetical protein